MSHKECKIRTFALTRSLDISGVSGVGVVAEGAVFSNGRVVLHWLSDLDSVEIISDVETLEKIHGHNGTTTIRWL